LNLKLLSIMLSSHLIENKTLLANNKVVGWNNLGILSNSHRRKQLSHLCAWVQKSSCRPILRYHSPTYYMIGLDHGMTLWVDLYGGTFHFIMPPIIATPIITPNYALVPRHYTT
jgi:hypothetical protein